MHIFHCPIICLAIKSNEPKSEHIFTISFILADEWMQAKYSQRLDTADTLTAVV